jgi:lipopolysaccharide heptosyltransferase II
MNRKILIVNVNWLGDVLLSTAAIRAIKKSYPRSFLACMVVERCVEVLENNPYLDEIIIFDETALHKGIIAKIKFTQELKKKNFDIVFLFHRSFTRTLITFLSGIPERVGYYTKKRGFLLTKKIELPNKGIHRLEYYLNIITSCGIKSDGKYCDFFISDHDKKYASEFFKNENIQDNDFIVVINPGGNWQPKRWPEENFAQLCQRLIQELKAKIIISGSSKDITLANRIVSLMRSRPMISAGKTTLKQLGALMQRSDLVISADSGPMHIAAAVGVDLIALFGPTSDSVTGPIGKGKIAVIKKDINCKIPCYESHCQKGYLCMRNITVEDVFEKVKEFRD